MKRKTRLSLLVIMVIVCAFNNAGKLSGQSNLGINAGFGFPDFINAGVIYQIGQVQTGLAAGFMPVGGESVTSASFNITVHLAGYSSLTAIKPWYGRLGLSYMHDKKKDVFNDKFVFIDFRGGRELNISENFGVSVDAGLMFKVYSDVQDNDLSRFIDKLLTGFPSAGIRFFYLF